jgi:hypothetical protein
MANFGGFLQGLGLAYGNSLIAGQNFQEQEARTSLLKSEALMQGIQAQKLQQQVKTEKDLGDFISSQMQLEGADAALPQNQAKMFTKAAGLAAASGDFASMTEMNSLAHSSQQQAREEATYAAQQQAKAKEDLGSAAQSYAENPTAEGANDLARKAIAAGQNPATIPVAGTPAFKAWANSQQLAGMTSKDRANFVQKAADMKARREEQWAIHADNVALRRESMQQNAALREQMIGLRRDEAGNRAPPHLDIAGATYQWDPNGNVKGERLASDGRYVKLGQKITATQENNVVAIGGAAAEAARNLGQMARFGAGTTQSPFAHMTDKGFTDAIAKSGTNALTPEQVQMFSTSSSGLATELSRVMTLGGGRGANQSVIDEVKNQITPVAGDTQLQAAYKLSTGAQIVLTRMEATPKPSDASVARKWDQTMEELKKFPTPEQVLAAASSKQAEQLRKSQGSYRNLLEKVKDVDLSQEGQGSAVAGMPGSGTGGGVYNAPPLPPGWFVTVK